MKTKKIISAIFVFFLIGLKTVSPQVLQKHDPTELLGHRVIRNKIDSNLAQQLLAAQPDFKAEMSCLISERSKEDSGELFKSAKKGNIYRHETKDYIDYFSPNEPPFRFTFNTNKFEPFTGDIDNHLWFELIESPALIAKDESLNFSLIGKEIIDFEINGKTEKREWIKIKVTGKTEVGGDLDKAEVFLYIAPELKYLVVKTELNFPSFSRTCKSKNVSFDVQEDLFDQFLEYRRQIRKTIILPKAEDVSEVSIEQSAVKFFTAESLVKILPQLIPTNEPYRPGRVFQNGYIKLKNGTIINWRAERGFILFYTETAEVVFIFPESPETDSRIEKMFFRGSVYLRWFNMTLTRDGNHLSGSYFYERSGRANSIRLSGSIEAGGKFILTEFGSNDRKTGKFEGDLSEVVSDGRISIRGFWKNSPENVRQFSADGQIIGLNGEWEINVKTILLNDKLKKYRINAVYPQFTLKDRGRSRALNSRIKDLVEKRVVEFRGRMLKTAVEDLKIPRFKPGELETNFNIDFANDNLISIKFHFFASVIGMDQELHGFETLSYDLKNDRLLTLADLFKPNTKYLEKISVYCVKELQIRPASGGEKPASDKWIDVAKADTENFRHWNLTRKGLLITFTERQITSDSAGIQTVLIPFAELREIIDRDSLVIDLTADTGELKNE